MEVVCQDRPCCLSGSLWSCVLSVISLVACMMNDRAVDSAQVCCWASWFVWVTTQMPTSAMVASRERRTHCLAACTVRPRRRRYDLVSAVVDSSRKCQ